MQFDLTEVQSSRRACLVVPGFDRGNDLQLKVVQAAADRSGLRLGFPESETVADADVLVVGRADSASVWHPTVWIYSDWASDLVDLGGNPTSASHLLSLAFDGVPARSEATASPPLAPALAQFAAAIGSKSPKAVHPNLAIFSQDAPPVGHSARLPIDMFTLDDRHASSNLSQERLLLMGRARYLLHGAYYWLPRGVWRTTIMFSADAAGAAHNFRVEWGALDEFSHHTFRPGQEGRYSIAIDSELAGPTQTELRLVLASSSLGGELVIDDVSLERVG